MRKKFSCDDDDELMKTPLSRWREKLKKESSSETQSEAKMKTSCMCYLLKNQERGIHRQNLKVKLKFYMLLEKLTVPHWLISKNGFEYRHAQTKPKGLVKMLQI